MTGVAVSKNRASAGSYPIQQKKKKKKKKKTHMAYYILYDV